MFVANTGGLKSLKTHTHNFIVKFDFIYHNSLTLERYNHSRVALTFLCLPHRTTCRARQSTAQFRPSPLHWSHFSFRGTFFWGLRIGRIGWEQVEVWFMQFCYRCDLLVTRCIVLINKHYFLLHLANFRYFSSYSTKTMSNTDTITLPSDSCCFGRFAWLSSFAVHSAECCLTPKCSARSTFYQLSQIIWKNLLYFALTAPNTALNH